jgi:hypothetical protein
MPRLSQVTAGLVSGVVACCWLTASCRPPERPQFDSRTPASVAVIVDEKQVGAVTNTAVLMSVLGQGKFIPPHPCAARGQLILRYHGGDQVRVSLYPGHSGSQYEFAVGGKGYTVARMRFLGVLEAEGVATEGLLK